MSVRVKPNRPPTIGNLVSLIQVLAIDLTIQQCAALARGIAKSLEAAYRERRLIPPKWVRQLARRVAGPAKLIA